MKKWQYLDKFENKSIYIIREAYRFYRDRLVVLWSIGKYSITMIYLLRKAFFDRVPIPILNLKKFMNSGIDI
jgi:sulfate adenylyltransferase subunit 2